MYRLLMFLLVVLHFSSCKKYEGLEVELPDPEYAIPLGTFNLGINDVIEGINDSTTLLIDAEGLIHLKYKGIIQDFKGTDIAAFIDQWAGVFPVFNLSRGNLPFSTPGNIDLDYALLSEGKIIFGYASSHPEPVNMTITLKNILDDLGNPYIYSRDHEEPFAEFFTDTIDLTGYRLQPTNDSVVLTYDLFLKNSGVFDKIDLWGVNIIGFGASYIEGYLGQETFSIEDPSINVIIKNGFGFPIRSEGTAMNFFLEDGSIVPLNSAVINDINVDFPSFSEVGVTKTTVFPFNNTNSNISDLILSRPEALEYQFKAIPNPDLDTSIRGFFVDSSAFQIQVDVDLPLHGWARNFLAEDTSKIDLEPIDQKILSAELKMNIDNGLPLNVDLQAYFLDENNVAIDSLFNGDLQLLEGPGVGEPAVSKSILIPLTASQIDNLFLAKQIAATAILNTSGGDEISIKVLENQLIDLSMGLKINLER